MLIESKAEKTKAKVGIFFGNIYNHRAEIRRDTFRWVSSKPGQIIEKFAYVLLPQIKYDCFGISKSFLWLLLKSLLQRNQIYDPCKVDDR